MEKISLVSDSFRLEALLCEGWHKQKGVVVTHPYPPLGGDMYNVVVESIAGAYHRKGYTTLRPNFRGVGNSEGVFDDGIGEQGDVLASISYLLGRGISTIDLAGYSFGCWVNASVSVKEYPVRHQIMVSPPVGFFRFPELPIDRLSLVVSGDADEYGSPEAIRDMMPVWNPDAHLEFIPDCDHFYSGCLQELEAVLSRHIG